MNLQAQDAECGCHEQQEVNEKQSKPRNSPSHNHDSTAPRQHPLVYTGAGSIHPVHGPLLSPATEAIAPKGFTFLPFWRGFLIDTSRTAEHQLGLIDTSRTAEHQLGRFTGELTRQKIKKYVAMCLKQGKSTGPDRCHNRFTKTMTDEEFQSVKCG